MVPHLIIMLLFLLFPRQSTSTTFITGIHIHLRESTVTFIINTVIAIIVFTLGPHVWYARFHYLFCKLTSRKTQASKAGEGKKSAAQLRAEEVLSHFKDVVLPESLITRIQQLAIATRNARNNRVPYRHLLLYGPPGTVYTHTLSLSLSLTCMRLVSFDLSLSLFLHLTLTHPYTYTLTG
jgi:hypothetical protein